MNHNRVILRIYLNSHITFVQMCTDGFWSTSNMVVRMCVGHLHNNDNDCVVFSLSSALGVFEDHYDNV